MSSVLLPAGRAVLRNSCAPALQVAVVITLYSIPYAALAYTGLHKEEEPEPARVYILDVYSGLQDMEPGAIQFLRIVQLSSQDGEAGVSGECVDSEEMKVIGTVPVEKDGSAYFFVPSTIPLRFEALNENGKAVGCSRKIILLQPKTVRGFTGLNESTDLAPPAVTSVPMALKKEPVSPVPAANVDY